MHHNRYQKQIVLPELGHEGQERLSKANVLCVGAGGLGSPALLYLAAAGVGTLGIIDHDVVEISNLQRQILYDNNHLGKSKVSVATDKLSQLNPEISLVEYPYLFTSENAIEILNNYDVIIDATDNFKTKYLINDATVKINKPFIYGSVSGFRGQVSTFWHQYGPCYRCLFPEPPQKHIPNCAEAGVIGAVAGVVGSLQAMEAIKIILGLEHCREKNLTTLIGQLYCIDIAAMTAKTFNIPKISDCRTCHVGWAPTDSDIPTHPISSHKLKEYCLEDALKIPNIIFIDVREPHEWIMGTIDQAIQLPLSVIESHSDPFNSLNPENAYVVYCQHGIRSRLVAKRMMEAGFKQVAHLAGGVSSNF